MSFVEISALAAFGLVFLSVLGGCLNVSFRSGRFWWDMVPILGLSFLCGGLAAIAVISFTQLMRFGA